MTGKELRQCIIPKTAPLSEKLKVFKETLLPRHPPIFHEWFLRKFPDPTSWLVFFLQLLGVEWYTHLINKYSLNYTIIISRI